MEPAYGAQHAAAPRLRRRGRPGAGLSAASVPAAAASIEAARLRVTECTDCSLCEGRTHAVPGRGAVPSAIMLVGEAPGRSEDLRGEPFVGAAGSRLDDALGAAGDQFNLHALALSSALLAAGAKQIIFYASYGGRRIIGARSRRRMRPFERLVRRYGAAAAFVAAATPIPDDIVYVPLGLARYNPLRFFAATLAGKVVLHYIIVVVAHFLGLSIVEPFLEDIDDATPVYIGIAIFGAALTSVVILLLRLDWARVLGRVAPWTLDDEGGETGAAGAEGGDSGRGGGGRGTAGPGG